jgi:MFS family permease
MPESDRSRRWSIIACIAAMMSMSVTLGLSWPLLAIILENRGVEPWLNGLSASVQMSAVLAVMPAAPRLISRFGVVRAVGAGIVGMAGCLSLLPVFESVWAWFPIRFGLGLCTELVFIAGDIWINRLAEDETRGRLIGVYGMFLHGGFALGPLAIMLLGSDDWTVLYLGVAAVLTGLIPLSLAKDPAAGVGGAARAHLFHYMRTATTLMVAGLMFGLIESSTESLLLVFGLEKGLAEDSATLLLTLFILGAILFQLPAGWLADHVEPAKLLVAACSGTMLALIALPIVIHEELLAWSAMLLMGASLGSFYVIAMTTMGRRYRGDELVGVNTSFVFIWGAGAAVGPGLSGASMTLLGPNGMPAVGILLCVIFLVVCLRQRGKPAGL